MTEEDKALGRYLYEAGALRLLAEAQEWELARYPLPNLGDEPLFILSPSK